MSETVPLLRNRFHMLRSFHGKSHLHPLLFFSTLSPCGGRDSSLPVRLPPLRDSFFCGVVGAASMRPARSPLPPIPRETTGGIYAAPTKRQRTVSTACCLIYLLYPISGFRRFPHTDLVAQLHAGLHLAAFERLQKLLGRFAAQGVGVKLHRRDGGRRLSQRAAVIQ